MKLLFSLFLAPLSLCCVFAPAAAFVLTPTAVFSAEPTLAIEPLQSFAGDGAVPSGANDGDRSVDAQRWVSRLGADSFHRREEARQWLLDHSSHASVMRSLVQAKSHSLLEIRAASRRLLNDIALHRFDANLARLNSANEQVDAVELPGWDHFSSLAGTDQQARRVFSRVAQRHHDLLQRIDFWRNTPKGQVTKDRPRRVGQDRSSAALFGVLDPYRLGSDETDLWMLLFCIDTPEVDHGMGDLTTRLNAALSHSGLGPKNQQGDNRVVLQRMVSRWLMMHPAAGTARDRLLIAMRYSCVEQANRICDRTFDDDSASPAAQAMAMLCASVLQRPDLEQQLTARIRDSRTAHVWQLIASRQKKIRTHVGDVALVLLLHNRGIDPREIGFEELQADPLLVFRDHSLGFADQSTRRAAYEAADRALASTE